MFRYADTNKLSKPGESQRKVVTEVRTVTYLYNNPDPKEDTPLSTTGVEIVKEVVVSPEFNELTHKAKVVGTKTIDNRYEVKNDRKKSKTHEKRS